MFRTSLKKAVVLGLAAAMTIGSGVALADRGDDDDDDDEEVEEVFGGSCDNSGNVGISLQLCNIAAPLSLLNLGENEQEANSGGRSTEDGDDGDDEGGCSNEDNVGIAVQVCPIALPLSVLNLGENEQEAIAGGGGDCSNDDNVGIGLQLCPIALPLNVLNLGENEQFAATP